MWHFVGMRGRQGQMTPNKDTTAVKTETPPSTTTRALLSDVCVDVGIHATGATSN